MKKINNLKIINKLQSKCKLKESQLEEMKKQLDDLNKNLESEVEEFNAKIKETSQSLETTVARFTGTSAITENAVNQMSLMFADFFSIPDAFGKNSVAISRLCTFLEQMVQALQATLKIMRNRMNASQNKSHYALEFAKANTSKLVDAIESDKLTLEDVLEFLDDTDFVNECNLQPRFVQLYKKKINEELNNMKSQDLRVMLLADVKQQMPKVKNFVAKCSIKVEPEAPLLENNTG